MRLLAIDPGNVQTAWVLFEDGAPVSMGIDANCDLVLRDADHLAIEYMRPRGMPTSQEEMDTQFWAGRFVESFCHYKECWTPIGRGEVKMHVCGSMRAKDKNVRQAIIDRFGGKEKAIGKKKTPGVLYGAHDDLWSALAIGVTWLDKHANAAQ